MQLQTKASVVPEQHKRGKDHGDYTSASIITESVGVVNEQRVRGKLRLKSFRFWTSSKNRKICVLYYHSRRTGARSKQTTSTSNIFADCIQTEPDHGLY